MRLVVTRPQPDADRQADILRARGHQVFLEPLLHVEYRDVGRLPLDGVQALVATSRNALRALARNEALAKAKKLPLFAVGGATATMAETLGMETVIAGAGSSDALAPLVAEQCRPEDGAILHVAGAQLAGDVKGDLEKLGFTVRQEQVYSTIPAAAFSLELRQAISDGEVDGAILMSPLTARTWADLARAAGLEAEAARLAYFCLSQAVGRELSGIGAERIFVAAAPREDDLLALIARKTAH
jgi:uroporphyrinogen-III synthase